MSHQQKIDFLKKKRIPLEVLSLQSPVSCINLTLDCLKVAFESTEQKSAWEKVKLFTLVNDQSGMALQLALQRQSITDPDNVEAGMFDPMGLKRSWFWGTNAHPNGEGYGIYRTGLIAVPPGYGY